MKRIIFLILFLFLYCFVSLEAKKSFQINHNDYSAYSNKQNNYFPYHHHLFGFTLQKKADCFFAIFFSNNRQNDSSSKDNTIERIAFYQKPWFYIILFIGIAGIVLLIFRLREREHKRERDSLKREKELLQTLMDNIPDTIYFKNDKSQFTRVNKAKARQVGVDSPEQIYGKTDFDFFDYQNAKEAFEDEKYIIQTGIPVINKLEYRKNFKGEECWYLATKVPTHNEKREINGIVGITKDITEQKRNEIRLNEARERAEESDRLKSAFLANMSHEIRTPLNGIMGFSQIIGDESLTKDKLKQFTQIIWQQSNDLLRIITDIMEVSKLETGETRLVEEEVYLNEILKTLYHKHRRRAEKASKKIDFKLNMDSNPDNPVIKTDAARLKQLLEHLIDNAFKFTPEGSVEIGYFGDDANQKLTCYVKDTGIGIPEQDKEIIFKRFGQVEMGSTRKYGGAGLGLNICKKLAKLLGGELEYQSEEKIGTQFFFSLFYHDDQNIKK